MSIDKFSRMARSLPAFYKAETNTMIRGLLKSWGVSDDDIEAQISNTKDQIFVKTAEGRYLDFLGNNVGVDRDPGLGMGDNDFRNLVPVLSFYPKQVRKTIISLLDVFWGPGFTRPNINSGNIENFNFGPESLLTGTMTFKKGDKTVVGTGTSFTTEVAPGDFLKSSTASGYTYQKVSAVHSDTVLELSENWKSDFALNTTASKGVVRTLDYIIDSTVAKTIRFKPFAFDNINSITANELIAYINADPEHKQHLAASLFLDPLAGNKFNLRTLTPGLLGSIQITGGDANAPSRLNFSTVKQFEVRASVYELNPNEIVIRIPSSVPVLRRTLRGASHPRETKAEIFSVQEPFDFSTLGASSSLNVTVDGNPYSVAFIHATDFLDPTKATAEEVADVILSQLNFLEAMGSSAGNFKKVGLRTTTGSSEYQVTGGTANTVLGFVTTLQQDPDLLISNYPSAYVFDPAGQLFTVAGVNTELAVTIPSGAITPTISVANAAAFPNQPGKVLFDFGRKEQEGPVGYNSRPNNSTLLIDASHIFANEHVSGRKVNLVIDAPAIPRLTGDDFPVYVVGTEEARQAAQTLIQRLIAAGVVIRFLISFPEVLFECVCRSCGPPETPDYRGSLTTGQPLVF